MPLEKRHHPGDQHGKGIYSCQPEALRGEIESLCKESEFHLTECHRAVKFQSVETRGKE